jgi:hypothetical protein
LAGIKLSGSPKPYGSIIVNINKVIIIIMKPKISLKEKYGWNGILSKFAFIPKGLLDPVWCKNNK